LLGVGGFGEMVSFETEVEPTLRASGPANIERLCAGLLEDGLRFKMNYENRGTRGSHAAFADSFFRLIAGIDSTGQRERATTFSVTLPINM
jgi:hypothetical protein